MTPYQVLLLVGIPFLTGLFVPAKWLSYTILAFSIIGIYWLQPVSSIHNLSFWLPTISIGLSLLVWAGISKSSFLRDRSNLIVLFFTLMVISLLSFNRYLGSFCCILPSVPPKIGSVFIAAVSIALLVIFVSVNQKKAVVSWLLIFIIIFILIIVKNNQLLINTSFILRKTTAQDTSLASAYDLQWLGFSYLAFRLIQILRDYQQGKLGEVKIAHLLNFSLFLPSFSAGPIDRMQRFSDNFLEVKRASTPFLKNNTENIFYGGQRVLIGLFKKFVIADTLTIIALNPLIASQIKSSFMMWIALYAFSLRIYFDFAGYTDIAIGAGNFWGIHLPENFNKPYQQTNITAFWNSWHMTLTQWFRVHFFYPLTRSIRSNYGFLPAGLVIFLCQTSTMILIGLWHGINWNFAAWGLWHALGLFINNRWTDFCRIHQLETRFSPKFKRTVNFFNWFFTFNYISLGWIWFVIPDIEKSINVYCVLFGINLK